LRPSRLDERDVRVVTDVEAESDGRDRIAGRAMLSRTAKTCGSGAPTLALSSR
jgi:hypothetical protein